MTMQVSNETLLGEVTSDPPWRHPNPNFCTVQIQRHSLIERGNYVRIQDESLGREFIGSIVDGPYHVKEDMSVHTLSGVEIRPIVNLCIVELTSVIVNGERRLVQTRPTPGSKTYAMDADSVQEFLGAGGDLVIGRLASDKRVKLHLNSKTLSRHLGIFGTTGSGKSNTLQVIAEEASRAGLSVLIFDVEGEYVKLNEPCDRLLDRLAEFGEEPRTIRDLHIYAPPSTESDSSARAKFGIPFPKLDREVFVEILGLTPTERVMFLDLIRKTKDYRGFEAYTLHTIVDRLAKRLQSQFNNPTLPEAVAEANMSLYAKLAAIDRLGIIDTPNAPEVEPQELLVPCRISVFDLSTSPDAMRNLVIAYNLDKLFKAKVEDQSGALDTPILILIEEVHTFISSEKRDQMFGTLTLMMELARRGRKRGISLGLVSQQPARLPPELFETINTRVIHRLSSAQNIRVLQESTGNVPESLWHTVPSLGRGEALVVSPSYRNSVVAHIRPATTKRLHIE